MLREKQAKHTTFSSNDLTLPNHFEFQNLLQVVCVVSLPLFSPPGILFSLTLEPT